MSERRNNSTQNDAMDLYDLGIHYLNEGDENKGMRYLHEAARSGYAHAYYEMSTYLSEIANGNAQLETQARQYMELALRAGDADALYNKGMRLLHENKHKEAADLFRQAIKSNHPGSLRALAFLIHYGTEKPQENDCADRYLQRAAELGDNDALTTLALGYQIYGRSGAKDIDGWGATYKSAIKARELNLRAANQGSKKAIAQLILDYMETLPMRDFQKSEMWINILASMAKKEEDSQNLYNVVEKAIDEICREMREACLFPLTDNSNVLLSHMRRLYFAADNIRSINFCRNDLSKTYNDRVTGSAKDSSAKFHPACIGLGLRPRGLCFRISSFGSIPRRVRVLDDLPVLQFILVQLKSAVHAS